MGTLSELIDRSQRLGTLSKEMYRRGVASFERFAGLDPRNWTPTTVEAWRDWVRDSVSANAANNGLKGLRYASTRFASFGHGPDFARPVERLRTRSERRVALSLDDATRILATCDEGPRGLRDRAMIVIGLRTGMRASELCNLGWSDISSRRATFVAKGGRKHTVILDDECLSALGAWSSWVGASGGARGKWIFRGIRSATVDDRPRLWDPPLSRQTFFVMVRARAKKAGVRRKVHPHLFRHTFVSWSLEAGIPPQRIMLMTGHQSIATLSGYITDLQAETDPVGNHLPPLLKRPR